MKQGNYLESRMFDIDPKKHKAQQKQGKIRTIAEQGATEGERAAGQGKLKDKTILPQILESREMDEIYEKDKADNKEFDEAVARGDLKEGVKIKQRISKQDALDAANQLTEFAQDWRAFKAGAAAGALIPDGPVMVGGELIGGLGAVALRRLGAETIIKPAIRQIKKEALDFAKHIMPNGYKAKYAMAGADDIPLSQRLGDAYDRNKQRIKNKTGLGGGTGIREIDKFAKVNKAKIRKYVEEFGGTEEDVTRIFNEHVLKQKNINQSRTWLNKYFKKLTEGLGPDGLKNAKIMDVDGVPKLVDGSTEKAIGHAFEVDHGKAKELMAELGLEGADFHENLDIVYTIWNRAKNNIGNPAIHDDVLRATGQSTSLRELVQRSLNTEFDAKFTRVPERFRNLARQQILEDIQAGVTIKGKPDKMRKQIIERHLKFWDDNANLLVELDDYVPEELLKDPDFWADPQQAYESLIDMNVFDSLKPAFRNRVKRMTDQWVKLNRGSTAVRDYLERTGGRNIKKKFN